MATAIGVSEKRLRGFEKGERVDRFTELKRACEWYLSFRLINPGRERLTTDNWQVLRQQQLRQLELQRSRNII